MHVSKAEIKTGLYNLGVWMDDSESPEVQTSHQESVGGNSRI